MEKTEWKKHFNELKNRYTKPTDIDTSITLSKILKPGDDRLRWYYDVGAEIEGYIADVHEADTESCNCNLADVKDIHIDLVVHKNDPKDSGMVVEITPRWHAYMESKDKNWTINGLKNIRDSSKKIIITGWMFFDKDHIGHARNTSPEGLDINRKTAWEIHPVTQIRIK